MLRWFQGLLSENLAFWFFPWVPLHLIVQCSRTLIYLCNLVWNWKSVSLFLMLGVIFLFLAKYWKRLQTWHFAFFASFPLLQRNTALSLNPLEAQKWYPSHSREWGTPPFKKLTINFELNSLKGNDYFLRRSQSTIVSCIAWLFIDWVVTEGDRLPSYHCQPPPRPSCRKPLFHE